ncbi:hypothetical protein ACO2Q1_16290 [Brevundimonas sp. VNH65]|uniref:hypothetical protein n=1 Tax=Brevundimonas sp. VNH65 TaxID=3400917 RepID=UPI003BFB9516
MLGHPLVTTGVWLAGLALLYGCWQSGGEGIVLLIPMFILMAWAGKAHDYMNGYRAWKRAWDGMAGQQPRRAARGWRKALAVVTIALTAVYLAVNVDQPGYGLSLGWMALVAGVGCAILLWRMVRRGKTTERKRRAKEHVVTVCARPVVRAPSLVAAYQAMPDYCHRLIDR